MVPSDNVSSLPESVQAARTGVFLGPGRSYRIWRHYADDYRQERVYAIPRSDITTLHATTFSQFLANGHSLSSIPSWWFCPVPFTNGSKEAVPISGVTTGGRTLALSAHSARRLGIPPSVNLDLRHAGWGVGTLLLKPEIKGAGARLSRTKLGAADRRELTALCPYSSQRAWARKFENDADPLFASLFMYEGRPLGAQALSNGMHALQVSMELLGHSQIRVAPTLMCVPAPEEYAIKLAEISQPAASPHKAAALFDGTLCTELRMTPSHVRAAYFDTTRDDADLVRLCRAVSTDLAVLYDTYRKMIDDSRSYIDTLCSETRYHVEPECVLWPKFGDVYVLFRRDVYGYPAYADEYKFHKRSAWYIAKDEVVVPNVGKVTVDAESVAPNFASTNIQEMSWHHELYVLNILRDHARVTAGYLRGLEVLAPTRAKRTSRHTCDQKVLRDLILASQGSSYYDLTAEKDEIVISLKYPLLGRNARYSFTTRQILGRSIVP